MKFKIVKSLKYNDPALGSFKTYLIYMKHKPVWINEKDFINFGNKLLVNDGLIELLEPFDENYALFEKKNKKGTFNVLMPGILVRIDQANSETKPFEGKTSKTTTKKSTNVNTGNTARLFPSNDVFPDNAPGQYGWGNPPTLAQVQAATLNEFGGTLIKGITTLFTLKFTITGFNHISQSDYTNNPAKAYEFIIRYLAKHGVDMTYVHNNDNYLSLLALMLEKYGMERFLKTELVKLEGDSSDTKEEVKEKVEEVLNMQDSGAKIEDLIKPSDLDEVYDLISSQREYFPNPNFDSLLEGVNKALRVRIPALNLEDNKKLNLFIINKLAEGKIELIENKDIEDAKKWLEDQLVNETFIANIPKSPSLTELSIKYDLNPDKVIYPSQEEIEEFKNEIESLGNNPNEIQFDSIESYFAEEEPDITKALFRGIGGFPKHIEESNIIASAKSPNHNPLYRLFEKENSSDTTIKVVKVDNPQESIDKKIQFISGLINLAAKDKVDSHTKNRLFNLIGSELQKTKSVEITILEKIQTDLKKLIEGETQPPRLPKTKPSHEPRATFNFLRGFRYPADSPFKFLTHSQANETDELGNIIPLDPAALTTNLNLAKNHPALIKDFLGVESPNFEPIHNDIREKAKELIKLYEKVLSSHKRSPAHPYEVSADYKKLCEDFKRNFRIGNSERESKLRNLIRNAAETKLHRFKPKITFHLGEDSFDGNAVFFSWMPALRNTFQYIFSEIESNSNINGSIEFDDEKHITIKLQDDPQQNDVMHLDIIDHQSKCPDSPTLMLEKLRESKPTQLNNIWGLCNWTIFADFHDGPFKVHVISDNHNDYDVASIIKLEHSVNGFIHRITFYKS